MELIVIAGICIFILVLIILVIALINQVNEMKEFNIPKKNVKKRYELEVNERGKLNYMKLTWVGDFIIANFNPGWFLQNFPANAPALCGRVFFLYTRTYTRTCTRTNITRFRRLYF